GVLALLRLRITNATPALSLIPFDRPVLLLRYSSGLGIRPTSWSCCARPFTFWSSCCRLGMATNALALAGMALSTAFGSAGAAAGAWARIELGTASSKASDSILHRGAIMSVPLFRVLAAVVPVPVWPSEQPG